MWPHAVPCLMVFKDKKKECGVKQQLREVDDWQVAEESSQRLCQEYGQSHFES